MAVYIKNFNKPKNCSLCPFNNSDCWCRISGGRIDRDDMSNEIECPIIEIEEGGAISQ